VKSVPSIVALAQTHHHPQGPAAPATPVGNRQAPHSANFVNNLPKDSADPSLHQAIPNPRYSVPESQYSDDSDLEVPYSADKHRKNRNKQKFNLSINPMMPKESLAYAKQNSMQSHMARVGHICRKYATALTIGLSLMIFLVVLDDDTPASSGSYQGLRKTDKLDPHWGGAFYPGYFDAQSAVLSPSSFAFTAVTDMDELSRVPDSKKPIFQSFMKPGKLNYDSKSGTYSMELGEVRTLTSKHNEAGRGMELSELTLYKSRLLAFDDRTGSIFEILNKDDKESYVVPRFVITEGDGDTDKGMKWEWATTKGDDLYIGSMGKEYTNPDGSVANTNNLWVARVNPSGEVERIDWTKQYTFVRGLLGALSPGYVIHEAVLWSEEMKKWIFIPRRVSSEKYDDVVDERKGTNKIVLVNEKFSKGEVVDIKFPEGFDTLHGFSTAAFVPGTKERHVAALRSVEEDCVGGDPATCKQRTYMTVFDVTTGDVLMEETKFDSKVKYEGLEFADIYVSTK